MNKLWLQWIFIDSLLCTTLDYSVNVNIELGCGAQRQSGWALGYCLYLTATELASLFIHCMSTTEKTSKLSHYTMIWNSFPFHPHCFTKIHKHFKQNGIIWVGSSGLCGGAGSGVAAHGCTFEHTHRRNIWYEKSKVRGLSSLNWQHNRPENNSTVHGMGHEGQAGKEGLPRELELWALGRLWWPGNRAEGVPET